jgi:hypothetical protein
VSKWKAEALAEDDMTERMFTYCIDELRYKSKLFKETGIITVYDAGVVKSDTAIPSHVKDALRAAVSPLENIPDSRRDWHPGSNETVLDLVHPSLFPVVYGQTRILNAGTVGLDDCVKRCGEGETLRVPPAKEAIIEPISAWDNPLSTPYSRKFQWLPCEVEFDGDAAKYVSLALHWLF